MTIQILALNSGSSSIKYRLYDWDNRKTMARGVAERIGSDNAIFTFCTDKECFEEKRAIRDHREALCLVLGRIDIKSVAAVAHRVVHGGSFYNKSVLIDEAVEENIKKLSFLAPLHNPSNLEGIKTLKGILKDIPHIAVFDTAFHQSIPEKAYIYPVPLEWYEKYMVRKYGFHGTSHLYVSKRAAVMLGKPASECNLITLHLGNGVSMTAIKKGLSVDTSMGFTPLEGLMMGTRSGDVDPSIALFMQEFAGLSSSEMYLCLNHSSGLKGVSGFADMRDVLSESAKIDLSKKNISDDAARKQSEVVQRCRLALDMYCYRLKQYIGKYYAALGSLDAIVFTAGIGENSAAVRNIALAGLEELGIAMDEEKNAVAQRGEANISAANSKVKIFVIPTNEELVLIEDAAGILLGNYSEHMSYPYSFSVGSLENNP